MTPAEFKKKWHRYTGKESAAYQEHFNDLCRLLGHPTPVEADPSGNDFFCFQKGVIKDAEMLGLDAADDDTRPKKGFADVWKKDGFGWEYKGKHKNLDEAYKQLQQYRESLLNPPLMVVCDFDRYIVRTNFTGTVREEHEFTNDQIDRPEILALLRHVFFDPYFLKPQRTTNEVTEKVAGQMAEVARSLQNRESVELADARTRAEVTVAQKKNLRIARFLNRIVFCFFAEDTALLPKALFSDILKSSLHDPRHFAESVEQLFRVMARGGLYGHQKIRHFNGHLFEDSTVFELTEDEIKQLADASEADWQFIQPSIMGTLFQRALDESQRSQLGAHYTDEGEIKIIVEPVLMAPLRREWAALKAELAVLLGRDALPRVQRRGSDALPNARARIAAFLKKLRTIIVLDPACGSGNFLYVSLQLLLSLEKEVITFATQLGFSFPPEVSVQQLKAIEINSYAFELAQVSVQIGYLQWRRDNGFDNDRSPVLQNLDGFQNEDALLVPHFRSKAKTLKEAQAGEHKGDDALKFYTEREWPECDVIVGNPPFIGNKKMRGELDHMNGAGYAESLWSAYGNRLPATSDLCCYWFEKARKLIETGKCQRAGLLATSTSKQISSRHAFERIKQTGKIFFAISDRDWFDAGTAIRICMVGFAGRETTDKPVLDGVEVLDIHPDLTSGLDTTAKHYLSANAKLCFMGTTKVGDFDFPPEKAIALLMARSPDNLPNSDVLRPFRNGSDLVRENSDRWIVDFGVGSTKESANRYRLPFQHVVENVKAEREKNNDPWRRKHWWLLGRTLPDFRDATRKLSRYLGTARVAKHRLFVWLDSVVLPDSKVIAIAFDDDYRFGVLQSRAHEVWTDAMCAMHGGERRTYNPTECFETFPFPFVDDLALPPSKFAPEPPKPPSHPDLTPEKAYADAAHFYSAKEDAPPYRASERGVHAASTSESQTTVKRPEGRAPLAPADHRAAIAAAAKELNELRERWLNPPEWTRTEYLEFPASVDGPWARYVECGDLSPLSAPDRLDSQAEPRPAAREKPGTPPPSDGDQSPAESAAKSAQSKIGLARYPRLVPLDAECAAKLKKRTLTKLYNERPAWLALAHKKLDAAVAAAYGWPANLSDEQILEKLLALNLERAAVETKAAKVKMAKVQRTKHAEEMI